MVLAWREDQDVGVCHIPTIVLINANKLHDPQKTEAMKHIFFLVSSGFALPFSFLLLIYDA